jgi:adenine deaminase
MGADARSQERTGLIADVFTGEFYRGTVSWGADGRISAITRIQVTGDTPPLAPPLITPPLVNAHVHVESSMVVPSRFGPPCLACGVGATVSDPHEIANVLGVPGVEFMLENAKGTPLKIHFGAPSCVPATNSTFETAGAVLGPAEVNLLLARDDVHYLAEVMNFPGVLAGDKELLAKIASAKRRNKVADGHAPGVRGAAAKAYIGAGISTDHECVTLEEALDKLSFGMKILIREGSAAKNFEALWSLISSHPASVMLCSDDLHPDELLTGNIDSLCRRALKNGATLKDVLRVATRNPVEHYGLKVGLLRVGDPADFVLWSDAQLSTVSETVLDGETVWSSSIVGPRDGALAGSPPATAPNVFLAHGVTSGDLQIPGTRLLDPIIEVIDRQIVTRRYVATEADGLMSRGGVVQVAPDRDIVKLVVLNRYALAAKPAVCLVKGTGLKRGAFSSSVGHDSHNVIACGVDDESLAAVINLTCEARGGIGWWHAGVGEVLALPVAGLMSDLPALEVGARYRALTALVKEVGESSLTAPYMTLSFLALLVIPELKLSDKGLFDVGRFGFV